VLEESDRVSGWHAQDIGAGIGIMGEIIRLRLRYEAGSGPLPSMIAKFATATPTTAPSQRVSQCMNGRSGSTVTLHRCR